MNDVKYIGLDVHQATISAAVLDSAGKLVMECILETKAGTILQFIHGLRGSLHVTLEEGTCAAWLHDLLKPHVTEVLVCDPRKNALLKAGNKNDRIDARKLADLLRTGLLSPVYHGENGVRTLRRHWLRRGGRRRLEDDGRRTDVGTDLRSRSCIDWRPRGGAFRPEDNLCRNGAGEFAIRHRGG